MPDAFSLNLGKNRAVESAVFIRSLHCPPHVPSAGRPDAGSEQAAAGWGACVLSRRMDMDIKKGGSCRLF